MDENDPAGAPGPPSGPTGRPTPIPDKVRGFGRPLPESPYMRRETGEGLYRIVEAVLVVGAIASTVSVAALALYVLFL